MIIYVVREADHEEIWKKKLLTVVIMSMSYPESGSDVFSLPKEY